MSFVELFFKPEEIEKAKFLKTTEKSKTFLFLLFLDPRDAQGHPVLSPRTYGSATEGFSLYQSCRPISGHSPFNAFRAGSGRKAVWALYRCFHAILALTAVGSLWYRKKHAK